MTKHHQVSKCILLLVNIVLLVSLVNLGCGSGEQVEKGEDGAVTRTGEVLEESDE